MILETRPTAHLRPQILPIVVGFAVFLALAHTSVAVDWWVEGESPVLVAGAEQNDLGVANLGQGKWMAIRAIEALYPVHPEMARAITEDLRVAQALDVEAELAEPASPERHREHQVPLLLGHLKALAKPFYDRLNLLDPAWVLDQLHRNGLTVEGTHYWKVFGDPNYVEGGYYPWNPETPPAQNQGVAAIGQLKVVLALRFSELPVLDSDGDGLPDAWELEHGIDPYDDGSGDPKNGPDGDLDGDGSTNGEEFDRGTDPTNRDSDGDGLEDPFDSDPNSPEYGLLNANFDEEPGGEPVETWSKAKLWPAGQVRGWQSLSGETIELKREDGREFGEPNDYSVELHGHFTTPDASDTSHGVTQDFKMLQGTSQSFLLRYKGREDPDPAAQHPDHQPVPFEKADNEFTLWLSLGGTLLVDGQEAELGKHTFNGKVDEWSYATVTIDVPFIPLPIGDLLVVDLTLTLEPSKLGNGNTFGSYVDLIPIQAIDKDSRALSEISISKMLGSSGEPTYFAAENLDRFRIRLLGGSGIPLEGLWVETVGGGTQGSLYYDDPEQEVLVRKEGVSWETFDHVLVPSREDDRLRNDEELLDDSHVASVDSDFVVTKLKIDGEQYDTNVHFDVRYVGDIRVQEFFLPDQNASPHTPMGIYRMVPEIFAQVGIKVLFFREELSSDQEWDLLNGSHYDPEDGFSFLDFFAVQSILGDPENSVIQVFYAHSIAADEEGLEKIPGFSFGDGLFASWFLPNASRTVVISGRPRFSPNPIRNKVDQFLLSHHILKAAGGDGFVGMVYSEDPFNILFNFRGAERGSWEWYEDFYAPKRLTEEQEQQILEGGTVSFRLPRVP
ncbi:MAG: hypothetical protein AAGN66_07415 [Acidobacteriota bacterium]